VHALVVEDVLREVVSGVGDDRDGHGEVRGTLHRLRR
jgi:hypothetical protein